MDERSKTRVSEPSAQAQQEAMLAEDYNQVAIVPGRAWQGNLLSRIVPSISSISKLG